MSRARWLWGLIIVAAVAVGLWLATRPADEAPAPVLVVDAPVLEAPAPRLAGRVLADGPRGRALLGARVELRCEGGDEALLARADRGGRFAFSTVPAGVCAVTARAEGYVPGGPSGEAATHLDVKDDEPLEELVFVLYEGASVGGRVLAGGRGVAEVGLSVLYLESPGAREAYVVSPEVTSDEQGRFVLPELGPGRVQVLAEHDDYALAESDEFFLRPGQQLRDLEILLSGGGEILGRVVTDAGRPVPEATVSLIAPGALGVRKTTTEAEGDFAFEGVGLGRATVLVRATGFADAREEVDVQASGSHTLRIVLGARAGFGGVVRGPDGGVVAGASVFLEGDAPLLPAFHRALRPRAHTDAQGRFWVDDWRAEWTGCYAKHARLGASETVPVPPPGGEVELRLRGGGSLVGRVVDPDGQPIERFQVAVARFVSSDDGQPGLGGMPRKETRDGGGRFAFESLAPGRYDLRVSAPGYPAAMSPGHEVLLGSETDAGEIVLERGGAVTGRVIDAASGEPVVRARVNSSDGVGFMSGGGRALTDDEGYFRLEDVHAERLSVTIRARGYVTRIVSAVEVNPGGETDAGTIPLQAASGEGRHGAMQYTGIGAVLHLEDERVIVRSTFAGSPSAESGLAEGTEILRVNGYEVGALGLRRTVEMIRGEDGTEVSLDIVRPDRGYVESVRIERAELDTGRDR